MQYVIKYTIWINISKENAKFHDKWCVLDQKAKTKQKTNKHKNPWQRQESNRDLSYGSLVRNL